MLRKPGTNEVKWRRVLAMATRAFLLAAVTLVAACSRFGNSMLEFSPASFSECKGPNVVVHVSWDATGKTKQNVSLDVYKPGKLPTVWYKGAPKGQVDTGEWMADGSTMRLIDADGDVLAMRTLVTTPCD